MKSADPADRCARYRHIITSRERDATSLRINMQEYDANTLAFWLDVFADALKSRGFRLEAWLVRAAVLSLRERMRSPTRARHTAPRALRRSLMASADAMLQQCRFDSGPGR